jgi:hypothetical protein
LIHLIYVLVTEEDQKENCSDWKGGIVGGREDNFAQVYGLWIEEVFWD